MSLTRRRLLHSSVLLAPLVARAASTKMKINLSPGAIGLKADQRQAIEYAAKYGFQAVEPQPAYLATLSNGEIDDIAGLVKQKNLVWGCANMSVDFRKDGATFRKDFNDLPKQAAVMQRAGVTRVGTYIAPGSDSLTFLENLRQHTERLSECALALGDQNLRLGLEYVAPKTLWSSRKYPFVHTMAEMKELVAAIHKTNVGIVLDSWHWYTAGETTADLKTLRNKDIVSVDLNDAPVNVPVDQQVDSRRELPCATGVIDLAGFLNALQELNYDGPVRCEPFNSTIRAMAPEHALPVVISAMNKAFGLIH